MTELTVVELACPECGAMMKLKSSRHGLFYGCSRWAETRCPGSHGAHPDGSPLGVPATREVKDARIRAHAVFDQLWQHRGASRKRAYRWLQRAMSLPKGDAHIGRFTLEQCEQLIALVEQELAATPDPAVSHTNQMVTS